MNGSSYQRFLEKAALREAQKAFRSREGVRKEDFLAMRVQTVEPWKRIAAIIAGLAFVGCAALALKKEFPVLLVVFFAALGALALVIGLLGSKRTVEAVLNATADALFQRLLDVLS